MDKRTNPHVDLTLKVWKVWRFWKERNEPVKFGTSRCWREERKPDPGRGRLDEGLIKWFTG